MYPRCKQAHWGKAAALNSLGDYPTAIQECDRALRIDSQYKEAHYGRGLALDSMVCDPLSLSIALWLSLLMHFCGFLSSCISVALSTCTKGVYPAAPSVWLIVCMIPDGE